MKTPKYEISEEIKNALSAIRGTPPQEPIKGRGNKRMEFPLLNSSIARELWKLIPEKHRYVSEYGNISRYISPDTEIICRPVIDEITRRERVKWEVKTAEYVPFSKGLEHLPSVQRDRLAPIKVNAENLSASKLGPAEIEELKTLLEGSTHPVYGKALELKTKSGLTWGQIQA